MTDFNNFKGAARKLDDIDIPRIGATIGVGEDELHAFMDVEAAGSGFDNQGRPKMLFEPHIFYRNLTGKKRDDAVKQGLAHPKWKKGYPKDSYPRLVKAIAIDETAALRSASWGLAQILGENHKAAGYSTPQAMVKAFMEGEAQQLEACVQFLISAGIADDLKAHRWAVVARVYNGPQYKANGYDTKMAAAFAKWSKIKDTPYPAPEAGKVAPETWNAPKPVSVENKAKETVAFVQARLWELGYTEVGSRDPKTGAFDGQLGKMTKTAILAFRNENDLPLSDTIDDSLLIALGQAKPRQLPRNDAAPAEVRKAAPEVKTNWLAKIGAAVVAIPAAVGAFFDGILGNIGAARDYIEPLKDMVGDVPGWVWLVGVAAVAGGLYLVARHGEQKGIEAYAAGERR